MQQKASAIVSKPGTFKNQAVEAPSALQAKFRWVQYGPSGEPVLVTLNAWRITLWINFHNPPKIDGVDFIAPTSNMTSPRLAVALPVIIGGAYQPDGTPLYVNQVISVQAGASSNETQAMLIVEEYHSQQSRQNR